MNHPIAIDANAAQAFLHEKFAGAPTNVALIGEGAWSRCFGFRYGGEELAIRFGRHVDDFRKDALAYRFAGPALPIPQVREIGAYDDLYYAIATRVHGEPLESVGADQWLALIPALVAAMEAMRTADLAATTGMGGWGEEGNGQAATWSDHLLAVDVDTPDRRTYGWRKKLTEFSPDGDAAFTWGYALLEEIVSDSIPRSLLHCDLMNRNVLVDGERITGVFDWGCSIYGDHLYELAWFEFWAPWTPELDIAALRLALETRWRNDGTIVENKAARLAACYLHIGLDHLAYNAYLGDWPTLLATAARMKTLVDAVG